MELLRSLPLRTLLVSAFIFFSSLTTWAQSAIVPTRVTQPVDLENLVPLRGNTHPLARPEFDQGAAPDSQSMERMLLVLQRSPEEETALRKLLDEQQIKSSPNYHMWLTPEQFGEQFGPADADIQAVTDWLTSQGFRVNRVATGRTVIEFSGTAGAVRQAFHTEIHRYVVEGEERWANASDPQIPAAFEPLVAGFASLNNFPRQPTMQRVGAFSRSRATGGLKPLFTIPTQTTSYYAVGPTDFATIYNVLPLWQASQAIDGTGQTIAIVAESNINVQDARDFRNLFGLPANDPQVILNGPDPGLLGSETEADLDVEWAGAVAKGATIDLVVSESTEATAGVDLSALYIIDTNLAPVMSQSFGYCEAFLGVGGNAFYQTTREQGAAQGITIVNSGGDSGSARCDQGMGEAAAQYGLAVSGMASTPFNVAVGGTDFNDFSNWSRYWSSTNNTTTLASALSYIPEMTWNDTCAAVGLASHCASAASDTPTGIDLVAGGGGASNCVTSTSSGTRVTCTAGYPKPAWQSGTGVPNDGARDIPDVSLFASDGYNGSFYVLCEADALPSGYPSCNRSYTDWYFLGAGGTSAAAPAFAGIMALVNQKTGERQGNANYVLYPLAAKSGSSCTSSAAMAANANNSACIFYDVPSGYNNSVACMGGTPNCSNTTSGGYGILEVNPPSNPSPAWSTTSGYDLATGLGSVNAANLVNNWASVSFRPTTTTLASLSPTTLTHGQPVSFTINVAPGSGSGTPTGDVSLIAQAGSSSSNVTGIGSFALSKGSFSGATNMLPGGTYGVAAHYAGDGAFGASDSTPPVQVTVTPEASQTRVALLTFDPATGLETSSNATSVVYGSSFNIIRVDVTNSAGQLCSSSSYPCPTGQVTLTDNGQPLDLGTYKLNSQGYTEDQFTQLAGGSHRVAASYSGDGSYNPSPSATDAITITPAPTTTTLSVPQSTVAGPVEFSVEVIARTVGVCPTGSVQFLNGSTSVGSATLNGASYSSSIGGYSVLAEFITPMSVGTAVITAQYSGDSYYAPSTSAPATITVTDFSMGANPSTINISAPGQSGTSTITITPLSGLTGTLNLNCGSGPPGSTCTVSPSFFNLTSSSAVTATLTITTTAQVSATPRTLLRRLPPGLRPPVGWPWLLTGLLGGATLMGLVTVRRRAVSLLFACSVLLVGIWVACGGGGGGGGGTPPPVLAPQASLSPTSLSFGQVNHGSSSQAQPVTLSNTGNASLIVSNFAIIGTNWGDFSETNNCGTGVAAGANCTISVVFTPWDTGSLTASLAVTDNASGSPQTVSLAGTEVPAATPPGSYQAWVDGAVSNDVHTLYVLVNVQ